MIPPSEPKGKNCMSNVSSSRQITDPKNLVYWRRGLESIGTSIGFSAFW